jgi:hypothetical protein
MTGDVFVSDFMGNFCSVVVGKDAPMLTRRDFFR